jgi:hypothetical protein
LGAEKKTERKSGSEDREKKYRKDMWKGYRMPLKTGKGKGIDVSLQLPDGVCTAKTMILAL